MSVQTSNPHSAEIDKWIEDELDLRRYLLIVLAWWREILLFTLLIALAATVATILWRNSLPILYQASVDIVMARLYSDVKLDPRVQTTNSIIQSSGATWRPSLIALVKSSTIAQAVVAELGDQLPIALQNPVILTALVQPGTPEQESGGEPSSLIRINVLTSTPELSALIANSWAKHYVDYVNAIYGDVPSDMIASVEAEVAQAETAFIQAETELQSYIANNQLSALQRQITEKSTIRDGLLASRTNALSALVTSEYTASSLLFQGVAAAPYSHALELLKIQSEQDLADLAKLRQMRRIASTYLDRAVQMQTQLETGRDAAAASNLQALQLLKLEVFGAMIHGEGLPITTGTLATQATASMSLADQLQDVQALVSVLEGYIGKLDTQIAAVAETEAADNSLWFDVAASHVTSATLPSTDNTYATTIAQAYVQTLSPNNLVDNLHLLTEEDDQIQAVIEQLEVEINGLQAQLAAEQARELQLTKRRDVNWSAYDALSNKLVELKLLRSSANSEVRMGSQALVPQQPMRRPSLLLPLAAVTVSAFLLMLVVALISGSLGYRPIFARR